MVEQPIAKRAGTGASACAIPSDFLSIVDQLMAVDAPGSHDDEIDRAVNRRAQIKLAREIRGMIDSDKVETDKAA